MGDLDCIDPPDWRSSSGSFSGWSGRHFAEDAVGVRPAQGPETLGDQYLAATDLRLRDAPDPWASGSGCTFPPAAAA